MSAKTALFHNPLAGSCIALSCLVSVLYAQNPPVATGIFQLNGPATITAVAQARPDTAFTFVTAAGDRANFSLPLFESIAPVYPTRSSDLHLPPVQMRQNRQGALVVQAPGLQGPAVVFLYDLAGRLIARRTLTDPGSTTFDVGALAGNLVIVRINHALGVWQGRVGLQQAGGRPNSTLRSAPAHTTQANEAQSRYTLTLTSRSSAFLDTGAITCMLSEGDNGTITLTMPPAPSTTASQKFSQIVSAADYEALFPNRYGVGRAGGSGDGTVDFYTYPSLLKAIDALADIRVKVVQRRGVTYCQKLVWTRISTNETRVMISHPDYSAEWNLSKSEDTVSTIEYGNFCAQGDLDTRTRELAAFCANIAHETTGGWPGAPNGGHYAWGLYWREEVAWQTNPGNTTLGYVDGNNTVYPPTAGKSYHGRGPIQLSWNYNYGQVSEFLFGDKTVLLQQPEKVLESGDLAFMTAIWFWMTPQNPKPSCHDIMCGIWTPTAADIAAGRAESRFGATVNVINGGLECGKGENASVANRIGHYQYFAGIFKVSIEQKCDCYTMTPF